MTGRVIIITGGNSGIGFEAAKYLAEGGNDVVLACRSQEKGDAAVGKIKELYPNALIQCMQLDLSSLASVKNFATEFAKKKRKLSVLINNAAIALNPRDLTPKVTNDGLELTMVTNHLGPFLLTNLLRDYLTQTAGVLGESRVINVTCSVHDHENNCSTRDLDFLDVDNFQLQKPGTFNGLQAYKNSKLCNVLMAYHMAGILKGQQVMVNAVDPGKTGKFFRDGVEERSSVESYDCDLQRAVWKTSCSLVHYNSGIVNEDLDEISVDSVGA